MSSTIPESMKEEGIGAEWVGRYHRNQRDNCPDQQHDSSCCCQNLFMKKRLQGVVKQKQSERKSEFARLQGLTKSDNSISKLDFKTLQEKLQSREITATAVLESYIAKALEANVSTNAITDFNPKAFVIAKELDSLSEVRGPLHGIPFCVKDDTAVEGMDATHGLAKQLYNPSAEDAVIVKILTHLGGIPFCKTNVPQTLFTYGSDNPVFGATMNAVNSKLSPGGSSSGTGALVGAKGVLFGTGTDIGGSLRIPAHFNGVSSIKPTVGRLSDVGVVSSLPNLVGLTAVPGIIGQSPSIVASIFKLLVEENRQSTHDPTIPPIPWNDLAFTSEKKLRIGYFTSLPYFPAMGDTAATVEKAADALRSLGHTLVPFNLPDPYNYMNVFARFVLGDQGRHFKKCWQGEEVAKGAKLVWLGTKIPVCVQKMIGSLLGSKSIPFVHSKRIASMFGAGAVKATDLWDASGAKKEIIDEMFAEWKRLSIDGLISPMFPFPAPPIDMPGLLPVAVCYCMIWNLVDFPAGVVGSFGKESGLKLDNYETEGDLSLKMAKKGIRASIGAPIGIQVVSLPFKEETVFRIMKELEPFAGKQ